MFGSVYALAVLAAAPPIPVVERPLVAAWGFVDAARDIAFVRTENFPGRYLTAVRLRTGERLWTEEVGDWPVALYRGRPVILREVAGKGLRAVQLSPADGRRLVFSDELPIEGWGGYRTRNEVIPRFDGRLLRLDWRTTQFRDERRRWVDPVVRSGVVRLDLETGKVIDKDPAGPKSVAELLPKGTVLSDAARSARPYYFGRAGDVVYCLPGADRVMMGDLLRWDARTGKQLAPPMPLDEGWTRVSADRKALLVNTGRGEKVISLRTGKTIGVVADPYPPWDRQDVLGDTLFFTTGPAFAKGKSGYSTTEIVFRAVDVATGRLRWSVTIREKD